MKIWNDEEVKSLFQKVEKCKNQKESLLQAFAEHAKKYSRKPNSVRNYYYHEVDNLQADKMRAAKLRIDVEKHKKAHFKNFDKVQEGDLFGEIDRLTQNGKSVRAACFELSGGDLALMTRFQNKYQNMKRKVEKNLESAIQSDKRNRGRKGGEDFIDLDGGETVKQNKQIRKQNSDRNGMNIGLIYDEKNKKNAKNAQNLRFYEKSLSKQDSKIIPFKIPRTLSDADINSLFLGLVRLIKKSAQDEVFEKSNQMAQAFEKKDKELSNLKREIAKLKSEKTALLAKIQEKTHLDKKLALEKHFVQKISNRVKTQNDAKRG